jgi:AcrR family transcriptional regulator
MSQPLPTTLPASTRTPTGRRARQRADTREKLFEAALDEFRSCGVAAAQIDRIAKAAGVVRGTFYFHFPTKDDVLIELRRRIEHQVLIRVTELRLERPPLFDMLLRVADALQEAVSSIGGTELRREVLSLYVRRPDAQSEDGTSVQQDLAAQIDRAQQRGELRAELSADQIASLFLNSTFGSLTTLEGEDLRASLYSLVGVIARGIHARHNPETNAGANRVGGH